MITWTDECQYAMARTWSLNMAWISFRPKPLDDVARHGCRSARRRLDPFGRRHFGAGGAASRPPGFNAFGQSCWTGASPFNLPPQPWPKVGARVVSPHCSTLRLGEWSLADLDTRRQHRTFHLLIEPDILTCCQHHRICPLRMMFIASYPSMVFSAPSTHRTPDWQLGASSRTGGPARGRVRRVPDEVDDCRLNATGLRHRKLEKTLAATVSRYSESRKAIVLSAEPSSLYRYVHGPQREYRFQTCELREFRRRLSS